MNTGQDHDLKQSNECIGPIQIEVCNVSEWAMSDSIALAIVENEPVEKGNDKWERGGRSIKNRKDQALS